MAEQSASEKTEQATPDRLRKAREEGQIPMSEEVPSAVIIIALLVTLALFGGGLYRFFLTQVHQGFAFRLHGGVDSGMMWDLLRGRTIESIVVMMPLLIVLGSMSVLASLLVSGWAYSPKALKFDLNRVSPFTGFKNLISMKSLVHLGVSLAKMAVIGWIAWSYLRGKLDTMLALVWNAPEGILSVAAQLTLGVCARIAVGMAAIALIDLLYQRWNYMRQMRMTKQEVKEERKSHEVAAEVKARVRAVQVAMARKRMLTAVPTADVVVVNPTHVAVALKYEPGVDQAPVVVAKGADFLCQVIKDIAKKNDVPIVEKPELARALYASVKEGQSVPETLFVAVAEVLAMIYRIGRRKK